MIKNKSVPIVKTARDPWYGCQPMDLHIRSEALRRVSAGGCRHLSTAEMKWDLTLDHSHLLVPSVYVYDRRMSTNERTPALWARSYVDDCTHDCTDDCTDDCTFDCIYVCTGICTDDCTDHCIFLPTNGCITDCTDVSRIMSSRIAISRTPLRRKPDFRGKRRSEECTDVYSDDYTYVCNDDCTDGFTDVRTDDHTDDSNDDHHDIPTDEHIEGCTDDYTYVRFTSPTCTPTQEHRITLTHATTHNQSPLTTGEKGFESKDCPFCYGRSMEPPGIGHNLGPMDFYDMMMVGPALGDAPYGIEPVSPSLARISMDDGIAMPPRPEHPLMRNSVALQWEPVQLDDGDPYVCVVFAPNSAYLGMDPNATDGVCRFVDLLVCPNSPIAISP